MIQTKWLTFLILFVCHSIFIDYVYGSVKNNNDKPKIQQPKDYHITLLIERQKKETKRKIKLLLLKYRQTQEKKYLKVAIMLLLTMGRLRTFPVTL